MQRLLTSLTLVGLLVATAAAFAITERLKLTKSAIYGTKVSRAFSPSCGCSRKYANVKIDLRRADTLDVDVVDAHRHVVGIVSAGEAFRKGLAKFRWDGTMLDGKQAPDGVYQIRVHLQGQHQTIVLPNRIQLDTSPPQVLGATPNVDAFSPDGDHQADVVRIHYRLNKDAHVVLYLGGRKFLGPTYRHPTDGSLTWNGKVHGHLLRPGTYTLQIGAVDLAGNRTPKDDRYSLSVRLRYIVLANRRLVVRPGKTFSVGVSTDAVRYRWSLGARNGLNGGPVLTLRAPKKAGRYTLTVTESGHHDRAHVVVR